jgi:hypothetical protein
MVDGAHIPADLLADPAFAAGCALETATRLGDGLLGGQPQLHLIEIPFPEDRVASGHLRPSQARGLLGNGIVVQGIPIDGNRGLSPLFH